MEDEIVKAPRSKIHGHSMLLSFRAYIQESLGIYEPFTLTFVEVGSERGSGSTFQLADYCNKIKLKFISVDADESNSAGAGKIVAGINPAFEAHHQLGEVYFEKYQDNNIAIAYLDAFDLVTDWPHIDSTINSYKKRNAILSNEMAYKMHYDASVNIYKKIVAGGFICFDDVWLDENNIWQGKGKTAIPFLLNNNYKIIFYKPNSVLLQNMNGFNKTISNSLISKGKINAKVFYFKNKLGI